MSTALKVVTWEDEFYGLMDSISTTYLDSYEYVHGNTEIVEKINKLAMEVYECCAGAYKGSIKSPHIPYLDDIWFSYEEHIAEVMNEATLLLVYNDERYLEIMRETDEENAYQTAESELWDQYLNSGSNDMNGVLIALKSMGFNYIISSDSEYTSNDLPPNIALSVGDAQNVLFPDFINETESEFHEIIGSHFGNASEGSVVAVRCCDDDVIGIGGEVKWN